MSQFIVDANSFHQLTSLTHPVDLCDPTGRVLGRFVPKVDLAEWEISGAETSEEELRRREQSNEKRYSTAEVLTRLENIK